VKNQLRRTLVTTALTLAASLGAIGVGANLTAAPAGAAVHHGRPVSATSNITRPGPVTLLGGLHLPTL
jgi:nitrous oxide reductase